MAVADYQTRDGHADYGFSIEFSPDVGWRVYIIFDPFHLGNSDSVELPYQLIDSAGRRYVDCSSRLQSLGEAKTVAGLWAELVQRYQRTQEQHALYKELIEHHLRTREQRRTIRPEFKAADHKHDAGRGPSPEHSNYDSDIPEPRASAISDETQAGEDAQ